MTWKRYLASDMDVQRLLYLTHILGESEVIIDGPYRKDIFKFCSNDGPLYKKCSEFIDSKPKRFAMNFCGLFRKSCSVYSPINSELKDFFTIFCDRDQALSDENKEFINRVQEDLKKTGEQIDQSFEINRLLEEQRKKVGSLPIPSKRIPIDRRVIIDYNLEKLLQRFSDTLESVSQQS